MGEILPRDYIIGIIIFMIIITGGIAIINNIQNNQPDFVVAEEYQQFNSTFNQQAKTDSLITNLKSKIISSNLPEPLEFVSILFVKGFNVLTSLFTGLSFMEDIITGTSTVFGFIIPNWLPSMIVLLITTIIIFSIVSAILQRDL